MALELNKMPGRRQRIDSREVGSGPGVKCENCGEMLLRVDFEADLRVCPRCRHHHVLGAADRVRITLDPETFEELDAGLSALDVISFKGLEPYSAKLDKARAATGLSDAILSGTGLLKGRRVAIAATDSRFLAGSMGSVVGERLVRLFEAAAERGLPALVFSGSGGGARMYEGLFSLMQMAKTAAAVNLLDQAGLPFISVCTQSTMGGVWASWAGLGDVILAEPRAQIGFTGPRVVKTTIKSELPAGFQSAEFLLEHGQLDMIVCRRDLRDRLAGVLDKLLGPVPAAAAP